jgi:hypothetical protein
MTQQVPIIHFDRFEEYKAVMLNYANVQTRRQNASNLFTSLNVVFLGAVGFLFLISHLTSWVAVGALGALALSVLPVNMSWLRTLNRYQRVIMRNYVYLQEIERELQESQAENRQGLPDIGIYLRQGDAKYTAKHGIPKLETELAVYFLFLYPAIAVLAGVITYLITSGIMPPLTLG